MKPVKLILILLSGTLCAHAFADDFVDIRFVDGNEGWLLSASGALFAYDAQANEWVKRVDLSVPYSPAKGLFFPTATLGFVLMSNRIMKTSDGGLTWHRMASPQICDFGSFTSGAILSNQLLFVSNWHCIIEPATHSTVLMWAAPKDDTLFSANTRFFPNGFLHEIVAVPPNGKWIAGAVYDAPVQGDRGVIYMNVSPGNLDEWTVVYQDTALGRVLKSVTFVDSARGWACGEQGVILFSQDGGRHWRLQKTSPGNNLNKIRFMNSNAGWVFGDKGVGLKTLDGGESWTPLDIPSTENLLAMAFQGEDSLWVCGTNGTLLWSFDRGVHWNPGEITLVAAREDVPGAFVLHQNYPNPFNPGTTIAYELAKQGRVRLVVYNLIGEPVETLVDGVQPRGVYKVYFDTQASDLDSPLASGLYIIELRMGTRALRKKMILLR